MIKLPKIKLKRKPKDKRLMVLIICIEILFIMLLAFMMSRSVSLNSNDSIKFADEEYVDTINCKNGSLIVNNVNVAVPTGKNMKYNISYSWGKNDTEYPSVPHAATVAYCKKDDTILYDISLYRSESYESREIPNGKDEKNWFNDWKVESDGNPTQEKLNTKNFHGFYIHPNTNATDAKKAVADYNNYSYYFAVRTDKGILIYVIEGTCLDDQYVSEFSKIMDACIQSACIRKPTP